MKCLLRPKQDIVIATIIVAWIIFWERHYSVQSKPSPPIKSPPISQVSVAPNSVIIRTVEKTIASPADPFAETMALIHLKLRQWSETRTGDRATQDRLMNELLAMLTDDNAAKIIRSLSPEELDSPFGISALFHWMKMDPVTAANWIASRPDATEDQAWVVAHNLLAAGIDLQNYSTQLPDTGWKQKFLAQASLDVISENPMQAVNLAQQMDPGSSQTNLLQTVASDWISNDPSKALDWIMSVNDPAMQQQLIAAATKAYAVTDPALSAEWLVSSVQSEIVLNDTLPTILEIWAAKDPAAAANWVAQFPEGSLRETAIETVASQWVQSDSVAAAKWIVTLPESN
jgi:hypothetical protein